MKSRKEIKALAKQAFKTSYWPCVGALVLYWLISCALSMTGVGAFILSGPILIGFNFYFVNVFMHGGCDIGGAFSKAFEDFGRKLGGYLWMALFLFLWALIPVAGFVIVIIKTLSYSLTTYILSDCPNVRAQDALTLSKRMMRGYKWQLFVFYLSFIGWDLLNGLTCGILGLFYVNPWKQTAIAGWYLERREQALRDGTVTPDELNGGTLREHMPPQGYNSYNGYNPGV